MNVFAKLPIIGQTKVIAPRMVRIPVLFAYDEVTRDVLRSRAQYWNVLNGTGGWCLMRDILVPSSFLAKSGPIGYPNWPADVQDIIFSLP